MSGRGRLRANQDILRSFVVDWEVTKFRDIVIIIRLIQAPHILISDHKHLSCFLPSNTWPSLCKFFQTFVYTFSKPNHDLDFWGYPRRKENQQTRNFTIDLTIY